MSALSAVNYANQRPAPAFPSATHAPARSGGRQLSSLQDLVALSDSGITLSQDAQAKRLDQIGNSTVDLAQSFVNDFAKQLFGNAGKGASISFDSVSLDTSSNFSSQVQHSSGPNGSSDSAGFSLDESAHFIGKGQIVTADGQRFSFEIEVNYQSSIAASASQSTQSVPAPTPPRGLPLPTPSHPSGAAEAATPQPTPPRGLPLPGLPAAPAEAATPPRGAIPAAPAEAATPALPTRHLPEIKFPGELGDLFKLLGRQLHLPADGAQGGGQTSVQASDGGASGSLTLRLLNLVNVPEAPAPASTRTSRAAAKYDLPDSEPIPIQRDQ